MAGQSTVIRVPWQGLDLTSAPPQTQPTKGTSVMNLLPGRPGKLVLRGPITAGCAVAAHTTRPGYWTLASVVSNGALFLLAGGNLQVLSDLGAPSVGVSFARPASLVQLARQYTVLGALAYGIGLDAVGLPINLWRWDGGAGTANVVQMTNGPAGPYLADVATHLNRVVVLGGDATTGIQKTLYWTDPGWDGSNTVAKWSDDVSGLVNTLVIDEQGHTLQPYNGALYILGTGGIQVLRGSAPSNWTVRKVSSVGCVGGPMNVGFDNINPTRNSVVADEGIYYVASNAVVLFDGAQTVDISGDLRTLISPLGNATSIGAEIAILDSDWLIFVVPLGDRCFLYHRRDKYWTEFTSGLFTSGVPKWIYHRGTFTMAMDDLVAMRIEHIGNPDLVPSVLTAQSITNGRDHAVSNADILATATTKLIELGSPRQTSISHRVCADIVLQSPAVSSQPAWTISLINEAGTVLDSKSGISTTTAQRQRVVFDTFKEADAVQLKWDIDTNSQLITLCALHDASLEFQLGADRTG